MNDDNKKQIIDLKLSIDHLREYVYGDICKKCEELSHQLNECEKLLKQLISND